MIEGKKSISEFLSELGTHDIHDARLLGEAFAAETGLAVPRWPTYTAKQMQNRIDARGKGGTVDVSFPGRMISTLDVAEYLSGKLVPGFYHNKMGMGFAVRACIEALERAGY